MKKILVVEDEEYLRQMIIDILNLHGFRAVGAGNGRAGVDMAFSQHPDLIICDVVMPVIDGYGVLDRLQKDKTTSFIPFIFLTAKTERAEVRKAMESGADDYITKPFTDDELINAVRAQFRKAALKLIHTDAEVNSKEGEKHVRRLANEDHIFLNVGKKMQLLKVSSIRYINSLGDFSNVHTADNKKIIVRRTMKQWESILPTTNFIRIHRTSIINMAYIERIEKWFNNSFNIYMKNETQPVIVSRRYGARLKKAFG